MCNLVNVFYVNIKVFLQPKSNWIAYCCYSHMDWQAVLSHGPTPNNLVFNYFWFFSAIYLNPWVMFVNKVWKSAVMITWATYKMLIFFFFLIYSIYCPTKAEKGSNYRSSQEKTFRLFSKQRERCERCNTFSSLLEQFTQFDLQAMQMCSILLGFCLF